MLLKEYVSSYRKSVWSMSVHVSNTALIKYYISPFIGEMKLAEITMRVLEEFYSTLLTTESVPRVFDGNHKKEKRLVAPSTV